MRKSKWNMNNAVNLAFTIIAAIVVLVVLIVMLTEVSPTEVYSDEVNRRIVDRIIP